MGRNREWETKRHSGSEGERTEMRDRDERVRDKTLIFFFTILLQCNSIFRIAL